MLVKQLWFEFGLKLKLYLLIVIGLDSFCEISYCGLRDGQVDAFREHDS
jgi:hypothetical protein